MGLLGTIGRVASVAGAPFTGGASLAGLGLINQLEGGQDSGTVGNIAKLGLGALGSINAGRQQGQANELNQRAIQQAEADFAARQPFRDQLSESFANPAQREDLGDIFASENAFARPINRPELGQIPGQAPPQGPVQGPPLVRGRRGGSRSRTSEEA